MRDFMKTKAEFLSVSFSTKNKKVNIQFVLLPQIIFTITKVRVKLEESRLQEDREFKCYRVDVQYMLT